VFNRLADPSSKQGVLDWLRETAVLPDFGGSAVHHEQLLRTMDALEDYKMAVERHPALCHRQEGLALRRHHPWRPRVRQLDPENPRFWGARPNKIRGLDAKIGMSL